MHHTQSFKLENCGQNIRSEKDKLQSVIIGKRNGAKLTLDNMKQIHQVKHIKPWPM